LHASAKIADARQHCGVRIANECGIAREARIGPNFLQRLLCRAQVADAVIEHRNERC